MVSVFVAQIDLALQITILALLVAGLAFMRMRKIKGHAWVMLAAVVLNLVSFAAIMGPAWDNVGEGGAGALSSVALAHVAFGGLAILSSLWVLGTWILPTIFSKNAKAMCYGKFNKRLMVAVTLLWVTALAAGIALFLMVNTSVLGAFPIVGGGD
jgi:hypothetical protein